MKIRLPETQPRRPDSQEAQQGDPALLDLNIIFNVFEKVKRTRKERRTRTEENTVTSKLPPCAPSSGLSRAGGGPSCCLSGKVLGTRSATVRHRGLPHSQSWLCCKDDLKKKKKKKHVKIFSAYFDKSSAQRTSLEPTALDSNLRPDIYKFKWPWAGCMVSPRSKP